MGTFETNMGGPGAAFPPTSWSMILSCGADEEVRRRTALERLARQYWRPVYRYFRFQKQNVERAKDLTQDFLCHLIEGELLTRYDQSKGRFRAFLKGAVKIYLAKVREREGALKRGGGHLVFSLDVSKLEGENQDLPSEGDTPEEAFDRQWVTDVLDRSVEQLQERLRTEGRTTALSVYEHYDLSDQSGKRRTYREVAEIHGLSIDQIKRHLVYVRERLHEIVIETLSDGVATREEMAAEMEELFSI